jgi:multiple sugar transport system permease protein
LKITAFNVRPTAGQAPAPFLERHFPFVLILPSVVGTLTLIIFPLLYSLYISFTSFHLLKPGSNLWVGLRNYREIFQNPTFWTALKNSILFTFVVVNLELILGLIIALLLSRAIGGQGLLRALFMIPMMLPPVLVGLQFRWFFNDQFGLLNNILLTLGVMNRPIGWLVRPHLAMPSVMVADIWQNTPFMVIVLLAGLLSLPIEPFEAATVDGANAWQRFRYLTLPMLQPLILIALTIRSLDAGRRAFDLILLMTGGGPANITEVLGTYTFRRAIIDSQFAYGAAISYIDMLIAMAFAIYLSRQLFKARG